MGGGGEVAGRIGSFFSITEKPTLLEESSSTFCRNSDTLCERHAPHPNLGWRGEVAGRIGSFFSITEKPTLQEGSSPTLCRNSNSSQKIKDSP
ncbi:hypothetical protein A0128_12660 [Leptospira tipperaryensis]|uniref:Uncharacterized protein n=1 Tax=Leptospira tipperaryensis TaxID=2564040 RepID=A0A1D7UYI2_9LEPT|nr:hypothetical protein A0128_12660 [Leptospira tipperaryensis]